MRSSILTIILSTLAVMGIILVAAVIGGCLTWLLWPHVIPAVFPGLVASGMVVKQLSLENAILLHWLAGCLFRSSISTDKK